MNSFRFLFIGRVPFTSGLFVFLTLVAQNVTIAQSQQAQSDQELEQLSGYLSLVWGDARDGRHVETMIRLENKTVSYDLGISPSAQPGLYNRLTALNGEFVTIQARPDSLLKKRASSKRFLVEQVQGPAKKREDLPASLHYLSILVKYADVGEEPKDLDYFRHFFGDEVGQLGHYWDEQSVGQLKLTGDAVGWFTLPQPKSYYEGEDTRLIELRSHALDLIRDQVDLGQYQGINLMINGPLKGVAYGGMSTIEWNGETLTLGTTWMPTWGFSDMGIMGHELGHSYGLPHSNNSDHDDSPYDSIWDVMSASYASTLSGDFGNWGQHTIAYHKDRLGWIDPQRKRIIEDIGTYQVSLQDHSNTNAAGTLMVVIPGCSLNEPNYTTIEVRGGYGYDLGLPQQAVVFHSVFEGRVEPAWMVEPGIQGEDGIWQVGDTYTDEEQGIRVTIDAKTGQGFDITIYYENPAVSKVNIPDTTFKDYLVTHFDCNGDGEVSNTEARGIKQLRVPEGVSDLSGIEAFVNLQSLNAEGVGLTQIPDLSVMTDLRSLSLYANQLSEFPVMPGLTRLVSLDLGENQLTAVPDLSSYRDLLILNMGHNQISQTDKLRGLNYLEFLDLRNNQMTSIPELEVLRNLRVFSAPGNQLTNLPDLSGLHQLSTLDVSENRLTRINGLGLLHQLGQLSVAHNQLDHLNGLENLTQLEILNAPHNALTRLPRLYSPHLWSLLLSDNNLIEVPDVVYPENLTHVDLENNGFHMGYCADLERFRTLELRYFRYTSQGDNQSILCEPRGVHLTSALGGFQTDLLIRHSGTLQQPLILETHDNDGLVTGANISSIESGMVARLDQDNLTDPMASNLQMKGCASCELSLSYQARLPDSSSAEIIQSPNFDRQFTFYPGDWNLLTDGAAILNVGDEAATVRAEMFDGNGVSVANAVIATDLPVNGKQLCIFQDHFPNLEGTRVMVSSDQFIAMTLLRFSKDSRYLYTNPPLPEPPRSYDERWLAHITSEDGGFSSEVRILNRSNEAGDIILTPYDTAGNRLEPVALNIQGNQMQTYTKTELLAPETSHVQVSGDTDVVVSLGYRAQLPNSSAANIHEAAPVGTSFSFFPGQWELLFDGVAIVNTSDEPATVTAKQVTYDGQVRKEVTLVGILPAKGKFLGLMEDYFSEDDQAIISVESNQPMAVLALRLSKDVRYLYGNSILE